MNHYHTIIPTFFLRIIRWAYAFIFKLSVSTVIFSFSKMYWADWSQNRPKIEVANMDGTDRRVLVSSPLSLPNGLTIVHSTNELCYSDAGMWAISCVNLGDLSMRKAYQPAPYPFGITNFNRTLFWTDWSLGRIQRMGMNSKIPDKPLRSFVGSNGKIFDIKAVQPCGRTGEKERKRDDFFFKALVIVSNNSLPPLSTNTSKRSVGHFITAREINLCPK